MSYRVWAKEWVAVYTSDSDGEQGVLECREQFEGHYEGNVRDSEVKTADAGPGWPATLELYLPNVVAECRDETAAQLHLMRYREQHPGVTTWVTEFGSSLDKELENYGLRKLLT